MSISLEHPEYPLTRDFQNYSSDEKMSKAALYAKSGAALTLGVLPFAFTGLGFLGFKPFAKIGNALDQKIVNATGAKKSALRVIKIIFASIPGILFGSLMLGSAKLFGYSQQAIWRDFVKKPTGDGPNARLAQYGVSNQAGRDLKTISQAFFAPKKLAPGLWTLREWSQIKLLGSNRR